MAINEMTVQELKRRLDAREPMTVLDVREPWECAEAHLPGSLNIPLGQLVERQSELNADADLVVLCKAGGRSRRAAEYLETQGFTRLANLAGGMDAWLRDIEPQLAP